MAIRHVAVLLLGASVASACVPSVTGEDIERGIEEELRSVTGAWSGTSSGSNLLTLDFQLQQGAGSAVSGSGSMKENAAPGPLPISITGTFVRPRLTLTFDEMNFDGHDVQGTFQADYTSLCPLGTLHLAGTGYSRDIPMLLCEE